MPDGTAAQVDEQAQETNFDRLRRGLKPDSLAARLVAAYVGEGGGPEALHRVIEERLAEVRDRYVERADQ